MSLAVPGGVGYDPVYHRRRRHSFATTGMAAGGPGAALLPATPMPFTQQMPGAPLPGAPMGAPGYPPRPRSAFGYAENNFAGVGAGYQYGANPYAQGQGYGYPGGGYGQPGQAYGAYGDPRYATQGYGYGQSPAMMGGALPAGGAGYGMGAGAVPAGAGFSYDPSLGQWLMGGAEMIAGYGRLDPAMMARGEQRRMGALPAVHHSGRYYAYDDPYVARDGHHRHRHHRHHHHRH